MTLKVDADELDFIRYFESGLTNYSGESSITRSALSSIVDNNIETVIFEGYEECPYKVVGAYKGFNNNERIIFERALYEEVSQYYAVHRLVYYYSDDYGVCFLKSYSGDLAKVNALTLDNTEEYTPVSDYNPATKKYVDGEITTHTHSQYMTGLPENVVIPTLEIGDIF